eukprot:6197990-Pleurochrysis_carterae.AAC.3
MSLLSGTARHRRRRAAASVAGLLLGRSAAAASVATARANRQAVEHAASSSCRPDEAWMRIGRSCMYTCAHT